MNRLFYMLPTEKLTGSISNALGMNTHTIWTKNKIYKNSNNLFELHTNKQM